MINRALAVSILVPKIEAPVRFSSRWPIEQTVESGLIAGMVGGIIGFVWERKARKKVLRTI